MPAKIIFIQDRRGQLTVEGLTEEQLTEVAGDLLEEPKHVNCGRPLTSGVSLASGPGTLRVHRIYHQSVVDGPGMRSVLQVQGCPIGCRGCYVPETHAATGPLMAESDVISALLDGDVDRDGVTVLGGEPLAQAEALLPILYELKRRHVHLVLYTGYPLEHIRRVGSQAQRACVRAANLVIDGPFISSQSNGAGEYRGSRNQRLLDPWQVHCLLDRR